MMPFMNPDASNGLLMTGALCLQTGAAQKTQETHRVMLSDISIRLQ